MTTSKFAIWIKKQYISLARKNPVNFLCKSSSEFFYTDGNYVYINKDIVEFFNNKYFVPSVADAIEFRTKQYYKDRFEK